MNIINTINKYYYYYYEWFRVTIILYFLYIFIIMQNSFAIYIFLEPIKKFLTI